MVASMDIPRLLRKELCPFVEGTYMIKEFLVVISRNLVHPLYQIIIYPYSLVYEMTVVIPERVFNLKCPANMPWGVVDQSGLIGKNFM